VYESPPESQKWKLETNALAYQESYECKALKLTFVFANRIKMQDYAEKTCALHAL